MVSIGRSELLEGDEGLPKIIRARWSIRFQRAPNSKAIGATNAVNLPWPRSHCTNTSMKSTIKITTRLFS